MTDSDVDLLAWAYLSRVAEGPCPPLLALIDAVGATEAARAVRERELPEVLASRVESRRRLDRAAEDLELLGRLGGRLVTPDDPQWPAWRLLGLGRVPDGGVPTALWVVGELDVAAATERAVAVVGTRAASGYGEHVGGELCADLAGSGWTIVSGGAYGIDGAAHRGALAAGGTTVAVLACGVDRAYPAGHASLLREIARTGLVISEYPPGTTPARFRFLARNRLVAALSDATVVVEAGRRSGTRNTARWARELGRAVLAVPGPVTSASSVGAHQMIREGEARLVTSAAEVIGEADSLDAGAWAPVVRRRDGSGTGAGRADVAGRVEALVGSELKVYDALPFRGAGSTEELAVATGLPIASVRACLSRLELDELVSWTDLGWRRGGHGGRSTAGEAGR